MPNDTSQAASTQASEEAQVAEPTTEQVSAQQQSQTEQPLTREELRQIAREEATRIAQSQVAKGENRINQRIADQFAALEKNKGVLKLTDDQLAKARQDIITEAYAQPDEQQGQQANVQQQQADVQQLHPAVERAYGIMDKRGVSIEPADPEFKKFIEPELSKGPQVDADDLALATEKAIEAKKTREASNKEKASVRAPGGGGHNTPGEETAKSASVLWEKAYKK